MPYDPKEFYDGWYKRLGGPGFNPSIVFGQYVDLHPDEAIGIPLGPIRGLDGDESDWSCYLQEFTSVILWVPKDNITVDNVRVARTQDQLPLA